MSGVAIVAEILRADDPLTEVVAEEWIVGGELPADAVLPALLITSVSVIDRQELKVGAFVHVAERISVTVRADTYRDQGKVIRLVRSAARGKHGAFAGFGNVSVRTAGLGPELRGIGDTFDRTQDFRVTFNEPA